MSAQLVADAEVKQAAYVEVRKVARAATDARYAAQKARAENDTNGEDAGTAGA